MLGRNFHYVPDLFLMSLFFALIVLLVSLRKSRRELLSRKWPVKSSALASHKRETRRPKLRDTPSGELGDKDLGEGDKDPSG